MSLELWVAFVAFLPQFVNPNAEVAPQLGILALTFIALAILNSTLYAFFASSARTLLTSPQAQRRFNLGGGSLLVVAGIWALFAKRPS